MSYDEFLREKHYIAKQNNCEIHQIKIEEHPAIGELCIYINGKWYGYVDNLFYEEMWENEDRK